MIAGDEDRAYEGAPARARSRPPCKATRDVIVDLSELRFADSSVIVDLACLAQRLRAHEQTLWLAGAQPHIRRLIEARRPAPPARRAARRGAAPRRVA